MNIIFERIKSASHRHLHVLLPFYAETFPLEERRDTSSLLRMLNETDMFFSAVLADDVVIGLVVYWKFGKFIYIEHLAVFQSQRRIGIGEHILHKLQEEGNPILLEVEIPYDEASTKRVAFYQRCGFAALPVYYQQPPYRRGESVVPMMLFSDLSDWDTELLDQSIELFQLKVYYRKES
jgi:hypothetical protein